MTKDVPALYELCAGIYGGKNGHTSGDGGLATPVGGTMILGGTISSVKVLIALSRGAG